MLSWPHIYCRLKLQRTHELESGYSPISCQGPVFDIAAIFADMTKEDFIKLSDTLPRYPGVYRFIGSDNEILYVGKAKNLKNRVSNYFTGGKSRTYKTRSLVKNSERVEYTVVDSEHDALLLENNLIKEHQPRYNVNLRDDKTYTYICVKNERFPRVFFTRKLIKDGSIYYGPYTSKHKARIVLDLVRKLFPLRTCTLNLSENNIAKGKFKVCLEFHLGNCLGPCEGLESEADYNEKIEQVKDMLKGRLSRVKKKIKSDMVQASADLNFEKAQRLKLKLKAVEDYHSKSAVVGHSEQDLDVFGIIDRDKYAYVSYLKIVEGSIVHTYSAELVKNLNDSMVSLLGHAVFRIRDKFGSLANQVLLPFEIEYQDDTLIQTIPQRGGRHKLVELAQQNAFFYAQQRERQRREKTSRQTPAERILTTLKNDLNMVDMPLHIECFDNSNIQGSHPVASCVVFKNAKPAKKEYRKFNIKTVVGPDDFASMAEVVGRRYSRLLEEKKDLPQLIIIDGGKGQLNAAMKAINELSLQDKITVIGIAKRLEEIFFPGDSIPLYINKKSESLKLIQQLRNEAHRFAIGFHRDKRSQKFTKSSLTDIPGVGKVTATKLLKTFKSVKRLKAAEQDEITAIVGPKLASVILHYLHPEKKAKLGK